MMCPAPAPTFRARKLSEAVALVEVALAALHAVDLRTTSRNVREHVQAARAAGLLSAQESARALNRESRGNFKLGGVLVSPDILTAPHLTMDDFVQRAVQTLGGPQPHHVAAYTQSLRSQRARLLLKTLNEVDGKL